MPQTSDIASVPRKTRHLAPEKLAKGSETLLSSPRIGDWRTLPKSYSEQCLENGNITMGRLYYRKKMRSVLFQLIAVFLVCCNLVKNVNSTVAGKKAYSLHLPYDSCELVDNAFEWNKTYDAYISAGSGTSTEVGLELSLLDYDHILLPEDPDQEAVLGSMDDGVRPISDPLALMNRRHGDRSPVNLDGFNLLWLVASKLETDDKLIGLGESNNTGSIHQLRHLLNEGSAEVGSEIYLNSAWPRTYLRYGKKHVPISRIRVSSRKKSSQVPPPISQTLSEYLDSSANSNQVSDWVDGVTTDHVNDDGNVVRINRLITGKSIGFEMEFRVEEHSGSG